MDHHYKILADQRLTIMALAGTVTLDSMLAVVDRLYTDPEYVPAYDGIIDLSDSKVALNYDDMTRYFARIESDPQRMSGLVVFVTRDPVSFGMSRMYMGVSGESDSGVHFENTIEEALAWIDAMRGKSGH